MDLIRFCNRGSEAVKATLRLARAFTGRRKYIKFEGQYHGWFDNVLISQHPNGNNSDAPQTVLETKGQAAGVLDEIVVLHWNNLAAVEETFEQIGHDVAAVITEPIMCNNGCIEPLPGYLEGLRRLCDKYGAVLIFDEIITGFRLGLGGAQDFYSVTPDLATFGKAMASGFPISFFGGKRELMELVANGAVLHAGTYNSNNPSIAAAVATLTVLEAGGAQLYERLRGLGLRLKRGLEEAARLSGYQVLVTGPGQVIHMSFTDRRSTVNFRDTLECDSKQYGEFVKRMLDRGIRLIGRGIWYLSVAHTEQDIEHAISVASEVLVEMKLEESPAEASATILSTT